MQIVQNLLETIEPATESMETPKDTCIQVGEPAQEPCLTFQSIAVQTCPLRRNVRTHVVPKTGCKSEFSLADYELCTIHRQVCVRYLLVFPIQECKLTSSQQFKILECSAISFSSQDVYHQQWMRVYNVISNVHCSPQLQG